MNQSVSAKKNTEENFKTAIVGGWQLELLPSAPYDASYTSDLPIIGFSFDAQEGTHAFASDRKKAFHAKPNGLAYVPAGCDVFSESAKGGEYLKIVCSSKHQPSWTRNKQFSDVIDRTAIEAAFRLRRALLSGEFNNVLECEQSLMVLEESVATVIDNPGDVDHGAKWMCIQRFKRIDDFVDAHLDYKLTVGELAAAFGLSAAYFSREFKKFVGRPPHQYIVDKRLVRARHLLQQPHENLSAVALDCGFASHSHMAEIFRSRFGCTPEKYRRSYKRKCNTAQII